MSSLEYWAKREREHERLQKGQEELIAKRMEQNYKEALDEIERRIELFYERYAGSEGIDIETAYERVAEHDVKAYEKRAKEIVKEAEKLRKKKGKVTKADFSKQVNDELKIYNATMRISRLEMLRTEVQLEMLRANLLNEDIMSEELLKFRRAEYERMAGILGQKVSVVKRSVKSVSTSSYLSATSFNKHLWTNHEELAGELNVILRRGLIQGINVTTMKSRIRQKFGKSAYEAKRLLVTEMARVQGDVQIESYLDAGFDEYVFLPEDSACEICNKLDGKHFKIKDIKVGENFYPMHPFCKCSSAPYVDEEELDHMIDEYRKSKGLKPLYKGQDDEKSVKPKSDNFEQPKSHTEILDDDFKETFKKVDFSKSRRIVAKNILNSLDLGDIPISIREISARGKISFDEILDHRMSVKEYVLDSKDNRDTLYQMKTAFHEAYHASGDGRKFDLYTGTFGSIRWLDVEETFAETSSHYAIKQIGNVENLSPAYSNILVDTLPRLKQLEKFKDASTIADFGRIVWADRLAGQTSTWEKLAHELGAIKHDWKTYGLQYEDYIKKNKNNLVNKIVENMPDYKDYKNLFTIDLDNAIMKTKQALPLTDNESLIYSNILVNAMNMDGVK
ncbi:TPA: minor capsid protein [Streptococcus suis]